MFEEDYNSISVHTICDLALNVGDELTEYEVGRKAIAHPGAKRFQYAKQLRDILQQFRDPMNLGEYDHPLGVAVNGGNNYGDPVVICRRIDAAWNDLQLLFRGRLIDLEPLIDFCDALYVSERPDHY